MGKVGNGKFGKGKGKAGGKGKAKDQGGDAHNKQDQITRPLVCHPSVLQHSEIIKHPTIASASQKLREAEEGWRYIYIYTLSGAVRVCPPFKRPPQPLW